MELASIRSRIWPVSLPLGRPFAFPLVPLANFGRLLIPCSYRPTPEAHCNGASLA